VTDVYADFQEGWKRLRAGQTAQATVPLERARRREPGKASIREALGIAYFRLGRFADAEVEFRAVLDLSPVNDYAHYALGRCLDQLGRPIEAQGHYKLARSLKPGDEQYESRVREA
jgi:Flp pilus assembly protein TadD